MSTRLIIARHGNTFRKGEIPRRVGGRTDLALVEEERGRNIGKYLKRENIIPDIIYVSPLLRTIQTAIYAMKEVGFTDYPLHITELFREIDYGQDENRTEAQVELRLGRLAVGEKADDYTEEEIRDEGKKIIQLWNSRAIVPDGWLVSPEELMQNWKNFVRKIEKEQLNKTVLIVTSNGIARFSPVITGDFDKFASKNKLKISTGALCIFEKEENEDFWKNIAWNLKPI